MFQNVKIQSNFNNKQRIFPCLASKQMVCKSTKQIKEKNTSSNVKAQEKLLRIFQVSD